MKLNEFYNPENDKADMRDFDDTRKGRLTLAALNKLRKYRELKKAENIEHEDFASVMYSKPAQADTGGF
jgi:hypothetical protein|tara:strand:- start:6612 stop:6818 length:207 start_codon:yes stop_codon:yes gene_type:complete